VFDAPLITNKRGDIGPFAVLEISSKELVTGDLSAHEPHSAVLAGDSHPAGWFHVGILIIEERHRTH
jgi:hypothetical protein